MIHIAAAFFMQAFQACHTPYPIPRLAQPDRQLHFHILRAAVRHRVEHFVQFGHQPQAVVAHIPIRLNARLVPIEAQVRVEPRHADVHARLVETVIRIRATKARLVPHLVVERDDVHVIMMPATRHDTPDAAQPRSVPCSNIRYSVGVTPTVALNCRVNAL